MNLGSTLVWQVGQVSGYSLTLMLTLTPTLDVIITPCMSRPLEESPGISSTRNYVLKNRKKVSRWAELGFWRVDPKARKVPQALRKTREAVRVGRRTVALAFAAAAARTAM
jgi:hypothetical protein